MSGNKFDFSFELNKSAFLMTEQTGKVYLSPQRCAYVLVGMGNADFMQHYPGYTVSDFAYRSWKHIVHRAYAAGATAICLVMPDQEQLVPIEEKDIPLDFYNADLNASIALLLCTRKSAQYQKLAGCRFIVPIRIKAENQQIVYATAKSSASADGTPHYVAFSDLHEYSKWSRRTDGWKPLFVSFDMMCQIGKQKGYILNPLSERLLLTTKIFNKYREYSVRDKF